MSPSENLVSAALFFEIVDEVLAAFGRDKLSPSHRAVISVANKDRVLQILAGPGSGKTEAIVWRVLYELLVQRTAAARIIVTTFTRRAATELQVRLVERSDAFILRARSRGIAVDDPQVHNLRVGTIHSLCDSLLAEFDDKHVEDGTEVIDEAEASLRLAKAQHYAIGYSSPPDKKRVINRLLDAQELVALFRAPWETDDRWPSRTMERIIFLNQCIAQHVETWIPRCLAENMRNGIEVVHKRAKLTEDLIKLQVRWEKYLTDHNLLDFATLQKRFWERHDLIRNHFDHIFVDEFQDSNPIQFSIHTGWLQNSLARLTVVGDDDQAIYRFRGSDIECFRGLEPYCSKNRVNYRRETLDINYRSSRNIVSFTEAFRTKTVLKTLSLSKNISAAPSALAGAPVRLLSGPWIELCDVVSREIEISGAGKPQNTEQAVPTTAVLMFSTSERESRDWKSPALALRRGMESKGIRVYNPRNKMAGGKESPVSMLFGLLSYLIDPVSMAPVGAGGRLVEVWASNTEFVKASAAETVPPPFLIGQHHASLQKAFIKSDGGKIGTPAASRSAVLQFADVIRTSLSKLPTGSPGRLTIAGFVARLLAHPLFRNSGFSVELFRQALFTQLLESNIAPTRLTMDSLDQPLEVSLHKGKFVWPDRFWSLLNVFGGYLENHALDDPEIESFEEDAVLMITFHQAKGLEFDRVYVAATGRDPDISPALRTRLFSGESIRYTYSPMPVTTKDQQTLTLALGDREREVYVALTRGRTDLTILHDPVLATNGRLALNPGIEAIYSRIPATVHPLNKKVRIQEMRYG